MLFCKYQILININAILWEENSNDILTFDCDMRLTHPEKNLDELKELFLKIKEKGFEKI